MFNLSEDMLEKIERQYKYDLVHNEDIAEDEKKKHMSVSTLPDYHFNYTYHRTPVDITLRWIVRYSGYKDCPCELAIEYEFDYHDIHFHDSIGDDVFADLASDDIDEELARSYTRLIMDYADIEASKFENDEI